MPVGTSRVRTVIAKKHIEMILHQPKKCILTTIFVFVMAVVLTACASTGAINVPVATKAPERVCALIALFDENAEARYDAARQAYKNGARPTTSAPTDPYTTGFAVMPLMPGVYGTDVFAFLPNRPLSDDEMLQLAAGMGGLDRTWFTQQNMLVGGQIEHNRAFSEDEYARYDILAQKYQNEGMRPKNGAISNDALHHDFAQIMLNPEYNNGLESFLLKPTYTLTDEQLLNLLDAIDFQHTR